jgi:hypothetical protein
VMPDSLATSPLGAALIPTLEEEVIHASMGGQEPEEESAEFDDTADEEDLPDDLPEDQRDK